MERLEDLKISIGSASLDRFCLNTQGTASARLWLRWFELLKLGSLHGLLSSEDHSLTLISTWVETALLYYSFRVWSGHFFSLG